MILNPCDIGFNTLYIGIHGKARSGKDTVCDMIIKHFSGRPKKISFADPLKSAVKEIFALDCADKDESYEKDKEWVIPTWDKSYRELLQFVGTEIVRNFDNDVWIKNAKMRIIDFLLYDYNMLPGFREKYLCDMIFVFSDVRFENEADFIRSNGGFIIHIQKDTPSNIGMKGHASESGIEFKDGDKVIHNNSTLEDLSNKVTSLCKEVCNV